MPRAWGVVKYGELERDDLELSVERRAGLEVTSRHTQALHVKYHVSGISHLWGGLSTALNGRISPLEV